MASTVKLWRDLPIQTKGTVVVLFPVIALLIACGFIAWLTAEQKDAQLWVAHTLQVRLAIRDLQRRLEEAAIQQKAAQITSDRATWTSAAKGSLTAAQASLSMISDLTADNPSQQARVSELKPLIQDEFNRNDGRRADLFNRKVQEMDAEELRLLDARNHRAQNLENLSPWVILITAILGIVGGLFGNYLLASSVGQRVLQLLESVALVANGMQIKDLDKSNDELG